MYDADIVFLLLSSSRSARFAEFLALHDMVANAGFHTVIATHPDELAGTAMRLRIIVIDDDPDSDFDVHAMIASLRRLDDVALMLLTKAARRAFRRGLDAGVDICLRQSAPVADVLDALGELASEAPSIATARCRAS